MGNRPTKAAENAYCKCRLTAAQSNEKLKSREGAAELLGLSPSTLADYELGNTKTVPVDKVNLMADLYNAPWLRTWYCANICPLGGDVVPVEPESIDRICIKALSVLRRMDEVENGLLDLAEDGELTEDEIPKLEYVLGILRQLTEVTQALSLFLKKE